MPIHEDADRFTTPLSNPTSDDSSRMYEVQSAMQADEISLVKHMQRVHDPKALEMLRRLRADSSR